MPMKTEWVEIAGEFFKTCTGNIRKAASTTTSVRNCFAPARKKRITPENVTPGSIGAGKDNLNDETGRHDQ